MAVQNSAECNMAVQKRGLMLRTGSEVIALTQEHIAKYISSAQEVVSGTLKYFVGERIVEVARKGVRITDKKRLQALALS